MVVNNLTARTKIIRIEGKNKTDLVDLTARETELDIFINNRKILQLNCSPGNYLYLAIGFLYSNGVIRGKEDIISVKITRNRIKFVLKDTLIPIERLINPIYSTSITKNGNKKDNKITNLSEETKIKPDIIYKLLNEMGKKALNFDKTGGVHSCGLASQEGGLLLFCEDISRYNTVDRIIGEALLKGIEMEDKAIITSCRITSGILKKIINGGIKTIISRSAVTNSSVGLAEREMLTLIGFARDNRMNIYSGLENIDI